MILKNKILIYGDANLNLIDGSTIWIINLAKLLAQDSNNIVDILLKYEIKNEVLIKSLKKYNNVNFLTAKSYLEEYSVVDFTNIAKIVEKIDSLRDYSCMIIRGLNVVRNLMGRKCVQKIIPYFTDFCQDKNIITEKEIIDLQKIYNATKNFFVQTDEMQEYLKEILNVNGEKFTVLPPIVFKENNENIEKENKTIVYAGKLAKNWNILELIEIMQKLYKIDSNITLYFIGNKFNKDLADNKKSRELIIKKINDTQNIKYYPELTKEQTAEIIKKCALGYGFRTQKIDNDNSLEISIKFLEYCSYNTLPIVRRTKMYERILGKDYYLFVENIDEAIEKIINIFSNPEKHKKIAENIKNIFKEYSAENIYSNIKDVIYSYPQKKLRLLIAGHDLKFIKNLYPYFKEEYELLIQELPEYLDLNIKEANELLKKVDIIWCEWMLLNAKWYSNNKYPHQKLFIRAHRFEAFRKFGNQLNLKNINKIITVSYYYYEQFIEKFKIPRDKITVVNNFVDIEKYSTEKNEGYKYNIALIGALPARKGLDRAIDLLINLRKRNNKYKLFIPGKKPEEMANTWNVEEEKKYYLNIYEKIEKNNLQDAVIWSGWIDIPEFLKNIGYTLSLSDSKKPESFHLAPLETMASQGIGLALNWEGIEYIYPENAIEKSLKDIGDKIEFLNNNETEYETLSRLQRNFVIEKYNISRIWNRIKNVLD